jgi:toxin-antitoxin system PIN domain toxin
VALLAPVIFGFLRLVTSARLFGRPLSIDQALQHVEAWLAQPQVHLAAPGPRHLEISFGLLRQLGTGGNLTTDVQLAAFAIEHQAELCSADLDFGRFPGLVWVNPLAI